jgi:pimeloyl-ACP methyl ester carboxylesterase
LRTWGELIRRLQEDYRCIAYDQRGYGDSDKSSNSYTIADLASDASELIHTLGLKRFVLVGHSMGAKAAQLLASTRPAGLQGLVLIAPASPTPGAVPKEFRNSMAHFYDTREGAQQAVQDISRLPLTDETYEMLIADMQKTAPDARAAWPLAAMMEDISNEVPNIDVPTLVLPGEYDPVDPVDAVNQEVASRIPKAEVAIVPGTGHLSPVEAPDAVASYIRSFLLRHVDHND